MKLKFAAHLILALSFMAFLGCSSGDDPAPNTNNNNNNAAEISQIENEVEAGTWVITLYIDSGQDETNHFNGYEFTFNANGSLMASNGSTNVSGSWSVTDSSNSGDDSPDDDIDFNIAFSSPPDFAELTDDWDIVQHSSTRIELIDISGGNGGTDNLVFEKN